MASTKLNGRTQEPIANAARSVLNGVKSPDFSTKSAKKNVKVEDVVEQVSKYFKDASKYDKELNNASVTSTIQQIRALLNQLNEEQIQPALEQLKSDLSTTSLKNIIGNLLMSQITSMFDDDAKASDIEDLKQWMSATFDKRDTTPVSTETTDEKQSAKPVASTMKTSENETTTEDVSDAQDENAQNAKDGDYDDSTPAKNFSTLQSFVNNQFLELNDKLKNIPGQTALLTTMVSGIVGGIGKIFSGIGSISKNILGGIKSIAKTTIGAFTFIGNGIKSIGSKVGKAITSPFKAVGGFFKSLNPFNKSKENAENRKQKAKDKIFDAMSKILEKIWKLIEPFVEKVAFFMGLITKFVIVPIAVIMTKILLVVAAIVALGLAAYLAYTWVKDNISSIWNYIKSGKIFKDIWNGLKKWYSMLLKIYVKIYKWIWDKLCEFGNWLYDKFINPYIVEPIKNAWNYITSGQMFNDIVDGLKKMWDWLVDFGKWIWDKLCELGNWLYDEFINPYIVEPFEKAWNYISSGEIIDDMIDGISKAWEWIKDIGKTITDAVVKWWEGTAIYQTWQEIKNGGGLWEYIKKKFNEWWNQVLNFGKKILDWWNNSDIGKWVNSLAEKINVLKQKLGQVVLKVPFFGFVRPFGPAAGLPFKLSDSEASDYEKFGKVQEKLNKNIEKAKDKNIKVDKEIAELEARIKSGNYKPEGSWIGKTKSDLEKELQEKRQERFENDAEITLAEDELKKNQAQHAKQLAQQQVNQAMKPINSISNMNADTNLKLQKEGQMMSQQMQEKEEKQQEYDASQYSLMGDIYKKINETYDLTEKNGKDPTVITTPVPVRDTERRASIDAPYNYAY